MAMLGRQPVFGLKSLNIPDEMIASIETEDDLMEALGTENNVEDDLVEEEVLPTDDEIQLVSVPTDLEMQSLENIPFIIPIISLYFGITMTKSIEKQCGKDYYFL